MTTIRQYGEFIKEHFWRYIFTLTPRLQSTANQCAELAKRIFKKIKSQYFFFIERNPNGIGFHIHAILNTRASIEQIKRVITGMANAKSEIKEFIPGQGWEYYMVKGISSSEESTYWDFCLDESAMDGPAVGPEEQQSGLVGS